MKPAPFAYHAPDHVDEACQLLARLDDAVLMAGNVWLGFAMSERRVTPANVIDINGLSDLDFIAVSKATVDIGALTRHRTIEHSSRLANTVPVLPESAGRIAGPAIRNMGTVGGNLAEGNPGGNYPTVLRALDATIHVTAVDGDRSIPIDDFFEGFRTTVLDETELVRRISLPRDRFSADCSGMAFRDLKTAPHTPPKLSAAGAVRVDDPEAAAPRIEDARLSLGNAADVPLRVTSAEDAVLGQPLTEDTLESAAAAAVDVAEPPAEMHADASYKRAQVGVYTRRALEAAYERAIDP